MRSILKAEKEIRDMRADVNITNNHGQSLQTAIDGCKNKAYILESRLNEMQRNINVTQAKETLASWLESRVFNHGEFSKMSKNGVINIALLAFNVGVKFGAGQDIWGLEKMLDSCIKND